MSFFKTNDTTDNRSASPANSETANTSGISNWTGLLRHAVTSMEQHIDRVLDAPTVRSNPGTYSRVLCCHSANDFVMRDNVWRTNGLS
jgi:hypothetical protein